MVPWHDSHNARDMFNICLTGFCPLSTVEHKNKARAFDAEPNNQSKGK